MGESSRGPARQRSNGGPFWPWSVHSAVLALPLTLVALLVAVGVARAAASWPSDDNEQAVLIGVLLLALMPLALVLLGSLVGGGSVEAFGVSIRFPETTRVTAEVRVPSRLGLQPGMTLNDSTTTQILDTLSAAVHSDVSVLDLEEGAAWWETRLLVLCAGATRIGRPTAVVFLATVGGVPQSFLGWATPADLLRCMLAARDDLRRAFERAAAVHRQWELAVPPTSQVVGGPAPVPPAPPFPQGAGPAAAGAQWVEFPDGTDRNPLAAEQLLALELGPIEDRGEQGTVATTRLAELFAPVLRTTHVNLDDDSDSNAWAKTVLTSTDRYAALTHGRTYAGMLPREQVVNDVLRALLASAPRADG